MGATVTAPTVLLTCRAGRHPWTEPNIYTRPDGRLQCRQCTNEATARQRQDPPPGWWLPDLPDAACQEFPELPWVPDPGYNGKDFPRMRRICAGCPELERCRRIAVNTPSLIGVWGGLTARERMRLRRESRR
jgi:WhiB family redox-sensing transcriptional regulator